MSSEPRLPPHPLIVAALGWVVPGAGYLLIRESWRGIAGGIAVVVLFVLGLLIGGVRVVDVPGYDATGSRDMVSVNRLPRWTLQASPLNAVIQKPWYIPQFMAGPITLAASAWSVSVADEVQKSRAKIGDVGTLYTAVAGMLNLILLIDAAHRSSLKRTELSEKYPHLFG
jgi:hypothetical protein